MIYTTLHTSMMPDDLFLSSQNSKYQLCLFNNCIITHQWPVSIVLTGSDWDSSNKAWMQMILCRTVKSIYRVPGAEPGWMHTSVENNESWPVRPACLTCPPTNQTEYSPANFYCWISSGWYLVLSSVTSGSEERGGRMAIRQISFIMNARRTSFVIVFLIK